MEVLDLLYEEHKVIKRALNVIEVATVYLSRGNDEAVEPILKAANFLLRFAIECHQGKEEEIFFSLLPRRGFPMPILEVIHVDHRAAEDYLRDFIGNLMRYEGGEIHLLPILRWKASGYLWSLRGHLLLEEELFFAKARNLFSCRDHGILAELFSRWEKELGDETLHLECESLLEDWERELRI